MPSVGASRSTGRGPAPPVVARATRPSAAPVRERAADRARRSSSAASCSSGCSWSLIARDRRRRHRLRRDELDRDLSQDLPGPEPCSTLSFDQPTIVYDRTGKVELGRFQRDERRVVAYRDVPRARARRDDDRRGPHVLGERRLRRPGDGRRRDRDAPAATRARRLDDHPAARPGAAAAGGRRRARRRPLRAQGQGAHPVGAPHRGASPARPARSRSSPRTSTRSSTATTRTASPPRPRSTSAISDLAELTPAQAALLAGAAQVALDPRPVPLRRAEQEGPAGRPARRAAGRPPRLDPDNLVDSRWTHLTPQRARRRRSPSRSSSPATSR